MLLLIVALIFISHNAEHQRQNKWLENMYFVFLYLTCNPTQVHTTKVMLFILGLGQMFSVIQPNEIKSLSHLTILHVFSSSTFGLLLPKHHK